MIVPRCCCDEREPSNLAPRERLARFVADLAAHGAIVREIDPLVLRRELAQTADDGAIPFSKRKR